MPTLTGKLSGTTEVQALTGERPGQGARWVYTINIQNRDTASRILEIRLRDGSETRTLRKSTVASAGALTWNARTNGDLELEHAGHTIILVSDATAATTEPDWVITWGRER